MEVLVLQDHPLVLDQAALQVKLTQVLVHLEVVAQVALVAHQELLELKEILVLLEVQVHQETHQEHKNLLLQ